MPSSGRTKGQIKATFVSRLERLVRLRREYNEDLNPLGLRLLDRAIYATYRDCIAFGAADEVRSLMATHNISGWDEAPSGK
jgi:hypothetical protein